MLVATPGQSAYPLHGGSGATKKPCHTVTSVSAVKGSCQLTQQAQKSVRENCSKLTEATTSTATALMKTLSVRLNRSTEFLKSTVQKALISTSNVAGAKSNSSITSQQPHYAASPATYSTAAKRLAAASYIKQYTVPPTITHRFPDRLSTISTDSLHKEMCHFKPIRSAPTTPWKCGSKSRGVSLKVPKVCLATIKKYNSNCDVKEESEGDDDDDADDDVSAVRDKDMDKLSEHVQLKPKPRSSLTEIVSTDTHNSAFVCLLATHMSKLCDESADLNKTKGKRKNVKATSRSRSQKSKTKPPKLHSRCTPTLKVKKQIAKQQSTNNGKRKLPAKVATPPCASIITASITGAKSKAPLGKTKSKNNKLVTLTQQKNNNNNNNNNAEPVAQRKKAPKRKISENLNEENLSALPKRNKVSVCYTPPVTRARLRQTQGKVNAK